jgi:hypothetical protein
MLQPAGDSSGAARAGRSSIEEPVAGAGTDAVVAAHDRALSRLAATLSVELKTQLGAGENTAKSLP